MPPIIMTYFPANANRRGHDLTISLAISQRTASCGVSTHGVDVHRVGIAVFAVEGADYDD